MDKIIQVEVVRTPTPGTRKLKCVDRNDEEMFWGVTERKEHPSEHLDENRKRRDRRVINRYGRVDGYDRKKGEDESGLKSVELNEGRKDMYAPGTYGDPETCEVREREFLSTCKDRSEVDRYKRSQGSGEGGALTEVRGLFGDGKTQGESGRLGLG